MRRNGTLILCYHRVAEGVEDPFHLCVRPGNFAAHLEEMSRSRVPSTLADVAVPPRLITSGFGIVRCGTAGHHRWLQGGAGAVDRQGRVALRLPIWPARRLRPAFGRCRAFGRVRHRVHHDPRNGPFLDGPLPPPEARGHGLGTASIQSSAATMETWLIDPASSI